jgi:integrase
MAEAKKQDRVLKPGTTHYVAKAGAKAEEEIPEGVTIRSKKSVQIEFMWQGRRYTESLPGEPTDAAVRDAVTKREAVLMAIRLNRFVYANEFPNSRHVIQERAKAAQAKQEAQVTMRDLFGAFLERYAKEYPDGHNALGTHREIVNSRLNPALGDLLPSEVTKEKVVNFRHGLRESLSDSRISNIMTTLRMSLDLAVERDLVVRNVARDLAPTKKKRSNEVKLDESGNPSFDEELPTSMDPAYIKQAKNADPLNAEERKGVLAQLLGQIRNLFLFAMWTGLRTGELIALRWCDVSPDGRRILVRLSFSKEVFTNTKGRRARWVDLTEPAIAVVKAQRELTGAQGRWVFHNPRINDRWQNSQRLRVRWIKALAAAGVRYRKPYQCRHTYASLMVSAGESPEWVADQMGHQDGRLVAEVYGRWLEPASIQPGEASAKVYASEWAEACALVSSEDPQDGEDDVDDQVAEEPEDEEEEF